MFAQNNTSQVDIDFYGVYGPTLTSGVSLALGVVRILGASKPFDMSTTTYPSPPHSYSVASDFAVLPTSKKRARQPQAKDVSPAREYVGFEM